MVMATFPSFFICACYYALLEHLFYYSLVDLWLVVNDLLGFHLLKQYDLEDLGWSLFCNIYIYVIKSILLLSIISIFAISTMILILYNFLLLAKTFLESQHTLFSIRNYNICVGFFPVFFHQNCNMSSLLVKTLALSYIIPM